MAKDTQEQAAKAGEYLQCFRLGPNGPGYESAANALVGSLESHLEARKKGLALLGIECFQTACSQLGRCAQRSSESAACLRVIVKAIDSLYHAR